MKKTKISDYVNWKQNTLTPLGVSMFRFARKDGSRVPFFMRKWSKLELPKAYSLSDLFRIGDLINNRGMNKVLYKEVSRSLRAPYKSGYSGYLFQELHYTRNRVTALAPVCELYTNGLHSTNTVTSYCGALRKLFICCISERDPQAYREERALVAAASDKYAVAKNRTPKSFAVRADYLNMRAKSLSRSLDRTLARQYLHVAFASKRYTLPMGVVVTLAELEEHRVYVLSFSNNSSGTHTFEVVSENLGLLYKLFYKIGRNPELIETLLNVDKRRTMYPWLTLRSLEFPWVNLRQSTKSSRWFHRCAYGAPDSEQHLAYYTPITISTYTSSTLYINTAG